MHSCTRVFFFIAEVCLLAASVRNAYVPTTKYLSDPSHSCQKMRKGVFRAGAAFVVLTGIVSELYYVSYSKANDGQLSYNGDTGTSESIEFVSVYSCFFVKAALVLIF
ncbi:hypothetical protein NC651_026461 [Populus alba x Populus x berolinensis]|nr:hypothetical protein NC651_026461 [Populus alba x Populus x berolinensis]